MQEKVPTALHRSILEVRAAIAINLECLRAGQTAGNGPTEMASRWGAGFQRPNATSC